MPVVDTAGAVGAGVDPVSERSGPTVPIRPLRFREQLDEPFALLQAHLRPLATLGGLGLAVALPVTLGVTGLVAELTGDNDAAVGWTAVGITALAIWLLRFVLRGATVAIGLADLAGVRLGLSAALRGARARFGPLLVAQLMFTLIGLAVLVPGAVLIITYPFALVGLAFLRGRRFVVEPVVLAEQLDHGAAVRRSKELTEGAGSPLAGLWLCQRLLFALLAVPLFGVPFYLSEFTGTHRWAVTGLLIGGTLLVTVIAEIVEAASRVVVYLDRRCVRDGMDIRIPGGAR